MYADQKGLWKQQAEGKRIPPCWNKCPHSGYYHHGWKKQMVRLVLGMYRLPKLFWPWLWASLMIVARVQTLALYALALSLLLSWSLSVNVHAKRLPLTCEVCSCLTKMSRQTRSWSNQPHILRGHVGIITKPSLLTESTICWCWGAHESLPLTTPISNLTCAARLT